MGNVVLHIKERVGRFLFSIRLKQVRRKKQLVNLNQAKNICITYNVTGQEAFRTVKTLVKELTTKQRQVMALGFINRKSIPNYCVAANSGYYFNLRDLNWYGGPKNDYIKELINKEFDILIDLTLEDVFVLEYVSGLSRSKLKVGRYSKTHEHYLDLMISLKRTATLEDFIDHVLHYLLILKSKQNV